MSSTEIERHLADLQSAIVGGRAWQATGQIALDAIRREITDLRDRIEQAEQEIAYIGDRGDHLVYRHEWEAFDRWQRGNLTPSDP